MIDSLVIKSSRRTYSVEFYNETLLEIVQNRLDVRKKVYIVDSFFKSSLQQEIKQSVIWLDANENSKDIDSVVLLVRRLISFGVGRDTVLVAVGGGIVQDVTAFAAQIMYRGVDWILVPTTLLSQVDSCIGSKSSINVDANKNLIGGFYPPSRILLTKTVLSTLSDRDLLSGWGELFKVSLIDGNWYWKDGFVIDDSNLANYSNRALVVKKKYIELDEEDRGPRRIFNLGHTFGHAIEAASGFAVPHGIAVGVGIAVAAKVAVEKGFLSKERQEKIAWTARPFVQACCDVKLDEKLYREAFALDKKHTSERFNIVIPKEDVSNDSPKVAIVSLSRTEKNRELVFRAINEVL